MSQPVLQSSFGDLRALKVALASVLSKVQIKIKQIRDQKPSSPLFKFTTPEGLQITEVSTALNYIGQLQLSKEQNVPQKREIQYTQFIQFDESKLAPQIKNVFLARLEHQQQSQQNGFSSDQIIMVPNWVQDGLKSRYMLGEEPSIVDAVIFGTLLPAYVAGFLNQQQNSLLNGYCKRMYESSQFKEVTEKLLGGQQFEDEKIVQNYEELLKQEIKSQPKGVKKGKRNILVTSALPYVNNVPHLGNIVGCVLSADCYARYGRLRDYNLIYICGTDEYGTATETKAYEEGITCQQVCDYYHKVHRDVYEWFQCDFDKFGRTPTRMQTEIAQEIFLQLEQNGYLIEEDMQQLYSPILQKFLADRYVIGTCPICKFEGARGDQCDNCGNMLNPSELINPKDSTGATPETRQTRHYFLDLPKLQTELGEYVEKTSKLGGWSQNCVQVTNAWLKKGLQQRCITRDLFWGTPIPKPGYEDKVLYVWFDATIGYVSITANYTKDWKDWWFGPEDVELIQFMGKDNVPFHTLIFPATQIGTKQNWTMMKGISVTEYLNYEGGKFSKSRGVGVFGTDAKETGIPVSVWRYFLLSSRPEQQDSDFRWKDLQAKTNNELLANLGNFAQRTLKFITDQYQGKIQQGDPSVANIAEDLGKQVHLQVVAYIKSMESIKIRESCQIAMKVSAIGNKFFQDNELWKLVKTDREKCATLLNACGGLIVIIASLIYPFMPEISERLCEQLNISVDTLSLSDAFVENVKNPHLFLKPDHITGKPYVLFAKLSEDKITELKSRFK